MATRHPRLSRSASSDCRPHTGVSLCRILAQGVPHQHRTSSDNRYGIWAALCYRSFCSVLVWCCDCPQVVCGIQRFMSTKLSAEDATQLQLAISIFSMSLRASGRLLIAA